MVLVVTFFCLVSIFKIFVNLCHWACTTRNVWMPQHTCWSQFSPSSLWVAGTELRFLGIGDKLLYKPSHLTKPAFLSFWDKTLLYRTGWHTTLGYLTSTSHILGFPLWVTTSSLVRCLESEPILLSFVLIQDYSMETAKDYSHLFLGMLYVCVCGLSYIYISPKKIPGHVW